LGHRREVDRLDLSQHDHLRRSFGRMVSHRCAYDVDFANRLEARDADDRRVVVPVLGDDCLHTVSELVRRAGGDATLVVLQSGPEAPAEFKSVREAAIVRLTITRADDETTNVPYGPSCTLADVLRVLVPGASITMRFATSEMLFGDVSTTDLPADALSLH
jgi:hypothetical protein